MDIQSRMFDKTFTRRGAQDKILARLFHVFVVALNKDGNKAALEACLTEEDREALANQILNQIAEYDYEPDDITIPD